MRENGTEPAIDGIAIIGMAGRFPGAKNIIEFWGNLKAGVESISHFADDELEVDEPLPRSSEYVKARSILADADLFDASFFGILPKEAELIDPQQRVFLECCWHAFEDAGYDPLTYSGSAGVFAGCSASTYFLGNVCRSREFIEDYVAGYQVSNYPVLLGSNLDFLATRVAYKLNLKGPAFTLQAGCATSLLAIAQACQSLLTWQCDMALAGGVSITFPQKRGYLYQPGGMVSPDGRCRVFDVKAQGTVFGSGCGTVLLKRLADAVADADHIRAVIRGFAVTNDGSAKAGFTAPGVDGQCRAVALAQAAGNIHPETIGYIEAHGTGTPLGDPIEIAALTKAFRARTLSKQFCAIGSVKSNLGHLDIAAGVTGLIKTVLSLDHKVIPASLHFEKPNPAINFEDSPFFVNTELREWRTETGAPRRAGVSAFGIGGTNAHIVLEEAPAPELRIPGSLPQLLVLSAKTDAALDAATAELAAHIQRNSDLNIADLAYTLQTGRHGFEHRRVFVARDLEDCVRILETHDSNRMLTGVKQRSDRGVAFMFPGQGAQYPNMGSELYRTEPVFRHHVDACSEILKPHLGLDLRHKLYSPASNEPLIDTVLTQPAMFVTEYALAQVWENWGVHPESMIGHSLGEFVAACLAGVFSLEDALSLIAARGRMMQTLKPGGMLTVRLPENEVQPLLNGTLSLAAVNSPSLCVVAGPHDRLENLQRLLNAKGVVSRRLATSHAFHSAMMDSLIAPFTELVQRIPLNAPRIPYISCVSGTWITESEATDPGYWSRHFRRPVLFSKGITELVKEKPVLLEIGPGTTLATLARQHPSEHPHPTIASLRDSSPEPSETASLRSALGQLWLAGVQPDWSAVHAGERRFRVVLPTYPFERNRHWIDPPAPVSSKHPLPETTSPNAGTEDRAAKQSAEDQQFMSEREESSARPERREAIRSRLKTIFADLSGLDTAGFDASASFLDLGFDSLFLTQVTQELRTQFQVQITFRQLLDDVSTLDVLASYIDAHLGPDKPVKFETAPLTQSAQVQPAQTSVDISGAGTPENFMDTPVPASFIERIMREQLMAMTQLTSQQLQVLAAKPASQSMPGSTSLLPAQTSMSAAPNQKAPALPSNRVQSEFKPFGPYKPVQKGTTGGLSEQQEKHINALIERYTRRTKESKRITQAYRQPLADPRAVSGFRSQWKEIVYPIVTVRSRGSKLWDVDGNEYIDILNGFGPIMFGHAPDFVTEAVQNQLREGFEIGPQSPLAGKVASLICELTGVERATFCNTGSEAVMAAIRVARTVTARQRIVMFAGAYHGTFDEVLVKGIKRNGVPSAIPIAPGTPSQNTENVVVLDYATPESLQYIREQALELAAVLVEPVQSRHPDLQPREFLRELREITAQSGTALIFDEVVTGFRVHPGGVQALFNIAADLVTYGKVIGGGLPIGILAGKAAFMDALDGGMWQYGDESFPAADVTFFAGTFVRHPLALAATHAVLKHLQANGPELQARLNEKTAYLATHLNGFFAQNLIPTRIAHFGSIFYFSFPGDQRFGSLFYFHLREKGIHIQEGFPCFLTTAHTDDDIERIIRAFKSSAEEMQQGNLLPGPIAEASRTAYAHATADSTQAPVTESQMEIWLAAQLGPEASCAYNESFTLHLRGDFDPHAFSLSIQEIIARHDSLRAVFSERGDQFKIQPAFRIPTPLIDLSGVATEAQNERLARMIEDDAHQRFDFTHGPLIRVQLARLDERHHAILCTMHHIVCDGWSTNVILDDLARLYSAHRQGATCNLEKPLTFTGYALAQSVHHSTSEGKAIEDYWVQRFKQLPQALDIPTDRPRAAVKTYAGATERRIINGATYRRIKRAGAQHKCTLFATLLGGFQMLLNRLSNQEDIVIGIPAAGQSLLDGQSLVGHCVNFLPLRSNCPSSATVAEWLTQTRQALLDAYEHQNYTYGRLIRTLGIPRDPSLLPLTQIQFNLERVGTGAKFEGLDAAVDPNPKSFVNFDIFLNIVESDDGLLLDCDYNSDLFDHQTIQRWLGHYQTILEGVARDAGQIVRSLPVLGGRERQQLLVDWNRTNSDYPFQSVHELFEARVARTPDARAVVFAGRSLSYSELNTKANQLARHLQKLGVGAGSLVGICLHRSLEMMIGLLGVLKAGAAYVPLDPMYPTDRLSYIQDHAGMRLLLTERRTASALAPRNTPVVYIDTDWNVIATENGSNLSAPPQSEDLAYVIYTSGSTGWPKGVEITHRSVVNLLWSMQREPGIKPDDRLLAVTTLSFDIAALELFLPVISGAQVVIAAEEVAAVGNQLRACLEQESITLMQATPITWRLLLEAGWKGNPHFKLLCGGEALPRELAEQLLNCGASLWNMYGPTETTIWSAVSRVEPAPAAVMIGHPIANTQLYVLDSWGEPVPEGVPGELCIGGDGVARGYHNDPGLTAEKFVGDAFSKRPGARLYKTGDLVRYRNGGGIEFLGRLDHQVKIRGFRIELGEIESVLLQYPGVREAVVIAHQAASGDKRLVAYIVATPEPTSNLLRTFLATRLPGYMIPSIFIGLLALPRTPNAKVDRQSLPAPEFGTGHAANVYMPPRDPRQQLLAEIWAEVLHLERVGIDDDLFDLGADSVHLFQIVARARNAGIALDPRQLLVHRTIAALCAEPALMDEGSHDDVASQIIPVTRDKFRRRQLKSEWAQQ
jgi:amino acid adenylation domain-containing protein